MHQQPPQTPLFASTSAAKSSQVSGVSRRVVYWVAVDVTVLLSRLRQTGAVIPGDVPGDGVADGRAVGPGMVVEELALDGAEDPAGGDVDDGGQVEPALAGG